MVRPNNPRFPHWCRIIRKTVEDPLEDEEEIIPMPSVRPSSEDDDFDPLGEDEDSSNSDTSEEPPIEDSSEQPDGSDGSDGSDDGSDGSDDGSDDGQSVVIYEGVCRSYAKNTTSDKGEVIVSYRGLALPLTQDDWDALGFAPQEGDEIAVNRGAYIEYGRVIDLEPANFGGTHLTWKYGRN